MAKKAAPTALKSIELHTTIQVDTYKQRIERETRSQDTFTEKKFNDLQDKIVNKNSYVNIYKSPERAKYDIEKANSKSNVK